MRHSTSHVIAEITRRVATGYPLAAVRTWEEDRCEELLRESLGEAGFQLVRWTRTQGFSPAPVSSQSAGGSNHWLDSLGRFPAHTCFLVCDFLGELVEPWTARRLRDLAAELPARGQTLIFLHTGELDPGPLAKDLVPFELPLPDYAELQVLLNDVVAGLAQQGRGPERLELKDQDRLLKAVLGLTAREARKALGRVLADAATVDDDVVVSLIEEKRSLAAGSNLLEFYDLDERLQDVGGLDQLKEWLARRSDAFSPQAREQGIPSPRGVLLLGVQGCGKSLTARVSAHLLGFPLVRLDIARLLSAERGGSEQNLREVLRLVESLAPAVLWVDEIEKGFAGLDGGGQDATMARLVGSFLVWMSEVDRPVFTVATANSVQNLPPEMLRRGRFDELFFIDLPNYYERQQIFRVHLRRRGWKPDEFEVAPLAEASEGFSGAELEQVVVTAMIEAYAHGRILEQSDLEIALRQTVPLSVTMEDKIFALRQWAETRCRRATSDTRVLRMLDGEQRRAALAGSSEPASGGPRRTWEGLARHGQMKSAVVDFVKSTGDKSVPDVQEAFAEFLGGEGDSALVLKTVPNTIVASGLSRELADLLLELLHARRLYLRLVSRTHAGIREPKIPVEVIETMPTSPPAKPVWLPCSLRLAPDPHHYAALSKLGRVRISQVAASS